MHFLHRSYSLNTSYHRLRLRINWALHTTTMKCIPNRYKNHLLLASFRVLLTKEEKITIGQWRDSMHRTLIFHRMLHLPVLLVLHPLSPRIFPSIFPGLNLLNLWNWESRFMKTPTSFPNIHGQSHQFSLVTHLVSFWHHVYLNVVCKTSIWSLRSQSFSNTTNNILSSTSKEYWCRFKRDHEFCFAQAKGSGPSRPPV